MDITPLSLNDVEIHLTPDAETREDWTASVVVRGEVSYQVGTAPTQLLAVIELARLLAWEVGTEERESEEPVT